jgi:hypothetical protein
MDVWCVCVHFCVFVLSCVYVERGIATSWSPVQGVLLSVNIKKLCSKVGARGRKKTQNGLWMDYL